MPGHFLTDTGNIFVSAQCLSPAEAKAFASKLYQAAAHIQPDPPTPARSLLHRIPLEDTLDLLSRRFRP